MQNKSNVVTVTVNVDMTEVKHAIKKAKRLLKLLKEANSLADELASKKLKLKIDV